MRASNSERDPFFNQQRQRADPSTPFPFFLLFFTVFCKKYNKPFILPESGAAFYLPFYNHTNATTGLKETYFPPAGPSEIDLKRSWWTEAWNANNAVKWPLLKAIVNFEEQKLDERVSII